MAGTSPSLANPPTVDSHHHFWDLERFDYEWMPPEPSVLRRNYLPRDLRPVLERNGVERTVLVQAHASVEEAEFLLALAQESPGAESESSASSNSEGSSQTRSAPADSSSARLP